MPTYEYACPSCGIVEVFQSIKEDALTRCPTCKKQKVTRMVSSGAGVIFKGSGFWETDYNRSQEYAGKAKADTAAKSAESAPATAAAAKPEPKKAEPPVTPPAKP
jgi:putative FmdB family regulatory protein